MKGGMAVVAVPFFGYNGGDYPCVPKNHLCMAAGGAAGSFWGYEKCREAAYER